MNTDYLRPQIAFVEREADGRGSVASVATLILSAPRCTFECLHCDLWQHALPGRAPIGSVVTQTQAGLAGLPPCDWLKLYNGGNFTDPRSIPLEDLDALLEHLQTFSRVIVENHPRMPLAPLVDWHQRLAGQLEVAMGLETANPRILSKLNKRMRLDDFDRAAEQLLTADIDLRVFVIAGLPWLDQDDVISDTLHSVRHAIHVGARHVSIIPLRTEIVALKQLRESGNVPRVTLAELEQLSLQSLAIGGAVITVDLWDLQSFSVCSACFENRRSHLESMNLRQAVQPRERCLRCEP